MKKNRLNHSKTDNDSLIDEEAFVLKNGEELVERKPPLKTSAIPDARVDKGRAGLPASEILTGILSDWLDTFGLNDADSAEDGDIVWVRLVVVFWDAGKE